MEKSKNVQSERMISRPLEILLRIFGIWPGASSNLFCKTFWLILITTIVTLQYVFLVTHHLYSVNFPGFMQALSTALAMTVKFIKLIIFWLNQRKFNNMWETMLANSEYSSTDFNATTTNKSHPSHFLPNFIVAFNSISVVMFTYGTVVKGIHYNETSNASRPYIIMMDLPFKINSQSLYLSITFVQFLYVLLFAAGNATINAVLIILMQHIGKQINIIRRNLMEFSPEAAERKIGVIMVKEIIKQHQKVITFSENIESLYTYMALTVLILNTLISCGLGFLLVLAIGTPNAFITITRNVMFYSIINIETFTFCFAGEYLSAKSKEIGEAAYSSPWYQSKFHSRAILFLIMRSQNQLTITMGKFMDLSLERFSSVIKASASYISVLLAMS